MHCMKNTRKTRLLLLLSAFLLSSCGGLNGNDSSGQTAGSESKPVESSLQSSEDQKPSEESLSSAPESEGLSVESEEPSVESQDVSSEGEEVESKSSEASSEEALGSEELSSSEEAPISEESSEEESLSSVEISSGETSSEGAAIDLSGTPWANLSLNSYGANFRDSLASLINATGSKTVSYSGLNDVLEKSDASPKSPYGVVPFYHNIDYPSGSWNKEHVWPNSRGVGKAGPGSDPQMIRPTLTSDNSARGNSFYGVSMSNTWDPATFGYGPARGEAARIIFYTATRYGKSHGLSLSNNPNDATSSKTMGVLKYLVQWNREYPVTQMERLRNDRLDDKGFARNPFIDFPELADYIWSEQGLRVAPIGDDPITPVDPPANAFNVLKTMDEIKQGGKFLIAAEAADATGAYASLNSEIYKSYYLTADVGQKQGDIYYPQGAYEEWDITPNGDVYTISSGNKVLGVEVSGTHYNLVAKQGLSTNNTWKINGIASDGKISLQNVGTNRYIEYFKGDFTSYNADKGVYFCAKA